MTVKELIKRLKQYPADTEVKIAWESTVDSLNDDLIYIVKDGPGNVMLILNIK